MFPPAVIHQPAKVSIFQLRLRTRRFVRLRISSRPGCPFPCSCEFHRMWGCNQIFRGWGTCRNSWRQVHRCRSDFATILSSSFCSCTLFAIFLVPLIKLEFLAQQVKLKWLMLNRWRRLFHSSRVKLPSVNMSASWCLVSMYLIWILGSRSILSKTNPKQLGGFLIRVSLWDFGLLMSSWSRLHCPQKRRASHKKKEDFAFDET